MENKHINETLKEFEQLFSELGIYTSEEQEAIDDFLKGKTFWDCQGNEWDLVQWLRVNLRKALEDTYNRGKQDGVRGFAKNVTKQLYDPDIFPNKSNWWEGKAEQYLKEEE